MSSIRIIGPLRDWLPEMRDPDTGDLYPGHWVQVLIAEALGSDSQLHFASGAYSDRAFDRPALLERGKEELESWLERTMRDKGVWVEDPPPQCHAENAEGIRCRLADGHPVGAQYDWFIGNNGHIFGGHDETQ